MEFQITMLTADQPIPSASSGTARWAPWSNTSGSISFGNATLSSITIIDDDDAFQSGRYTPGETQKILADDTIFQPGSAAIPAGTQLSNYISAVLRDTTQNADGSWNEFVVMFPRTYVSGELGEELGARYSVLIFPRPSSDGAYPVFDLTKSYRYYGMQGIGTTNDAITYPAQQSVPCFVKGSFIRTDQGDRAIEDLSTGDMVLTHDNGLCPIRWIGATTVSPTRLDLQPNLRPIRIGAGSIGDGVPFSDLEVSPQHRVLVRSRIGKRLFHTDEILVAAKHLVGLPGIDVVNPRHGVTYYHMLFDNHEVVLSNGACTESLYTGPQAMRSVGAAARREIIALFPQLLKPTCPPKGARRFLTGREAREMVGRHAANVQRRRLVETL